jgi:hypothetical protein
MKRISKSVYQKLDINHKLLFEILDDKIGIEEFDILENNLGFRNFEKSIIHDKIKNTGLSDKLSLTINCFSTPLNVRLSNSVNKSGLVSFAETSATASVSGIAVYSTNLVKTKI